MNQKTVLVTGANGYIGNAVAKAFARAGWRTFGLIRKPEAAADLARNEIQPVIGAPHDLSFLKQTDGTVFDVVVSNTEDWTNPVQHLDDVRAMVDEVARDSQRAGVRPLIMFSSGCKDYGKMAEKHGDPNLAPHTEDSPLAPPDILIPRSECGVALLTNDHAFDATVLRPTIVYGHSSSYYAQLFDYASQCESVLQIFADPDAIMHSLHVDDCAEAYVALAEHARREDVAGQAFNISNATYETARQIGEALASSYGLQLEFDASPEAAVAAAAKSPLQTTIHSLANFWQWVDSSKIRALTGWHERRIAFVDGIDIYRMAYEASVKAKS